MEKIISAIDKNLIRKELTKERFVKKTNYGSNEVYIITHHDSPNTMLEIGRLREISFRNAGGGTGKEVDIDSYDTAEVPYKQLIVWDPEEEELLGGYRFIYLNNIPKDKDGSIDLATKRLFNMSEDFIKNYLPYTIELGRSFVQPRFQAVGAGRQAIFALDNLWDGLGALSLIFEDSKYFFGKVTMYTHFNRFGRDLLLHFFKKHFSDKDNLLSPIKPLEGETDISKIKEVLTEDTYKKDIRLLGAKLRELGENIPPLINTYMNISPTLKVFGTTVNDHFGMVEETALMITMQDIYDSKQRRHLSLENKSLIERN